MGHIVSYFQQTWVKDHANKKLTSFYTKHTVFRGSKVTIRSEVNFRFLPYNHSKVLTKCYLFLHCLNINAYTYYIVDTLRSLIPIPPPAPDKSIRNLI